MLLSKVNSGAVDTLEAHRAQKRHNPCCPRLTPSPWLRCLSSRDVLRSYIGNLPQSPAPSSGSPRCQQESDRPTLLASPCAASKAERLHAGGREGSGCHLVQELAGPWGSCIGPMPVPLPCRDPGAAVPLGMLRLLPDHLWHLHQPDPQMVTHVFGAALLGHRPAGLARDPATETPSHPSCGAPRDILLYHHRCVVPSPESGGGGHVALA